MHQHFENHIHTMKVSFDYDGTLTTQQCKDLLKSHIAQGDEVYIITRRRKAFDEPVYDLAKQFGIPKSRVYFTNGAMKWETILKLAIELHYDNNPDELELIDENTEAETKLV